MSRIAAQSVEWPAGAMPQGSSLPVAALLGSYSTIGTLTLPSITQGCFYAYRLFEIAEEVDLAKLAGLSLPPSVSLRPGRLTFFGRLRSLLSVVAVGLRDVELETGVWAQADCTVLVFSFGVMSACFQVPIGKATAAQPLATSLSTAQAATIVAQFNESAEVTRIGRELTEQVAGLLSPAIVRRIEYPEYETYTLVAIQKWGAPCSIDEVLQSADLGRMLLGETPDWTPAPNFLAQLVSHHYRYNIDDLCVIDWNAAVTVDPSPTEDIPDLLALALTQLLEFQRYDAILERELNVLYEWTFEGRGSEHWWRPGKAQKRVDRVNRLLLDIGDFIDRSQNAFKISEDVHYARIYRGAIERFQVPTWRGSVQARQQAVAEVARTIYDRAQLGVAHMLEIIIILLIAFEIVYAFFK
jgi:hypothetical protein